MDHFNKKKLIRIYVPPLRGGLGGGKGGIAPHPPRILPPLPPAGDRQLAADAMWPKNLVTAC